MSTLVVTVKSEDTQAVLQNDYQLNTKAKRQTALALSDLFNKIACGYQRAAVTVQTGASNPVAASGTWTLATVIDTDVASVGGVSFTFTSSASLSTDVNVTVASAKAFASATDISLTNGLITETTHGYLTGDVGRLTTSSALPTGFALSTDYHVIAVSANTYKLASSQANALAGIAIVPTGLGVGNQTFTPTSDKCLAYRLAAAVNAHSTVGKVVRAVAAAAVVTVTCRQKGTIGNFIQFTDSDTTITSSGSGYLAGGTGGAQDDGSVVELGITA